MSKDDKKVTLSHSDIDTVTENAWRKLINFTDARVGLGRVGISVPTQHLLAFQLAHAQAIDAVHAPLNVSDLHDDLMNQSWSPSCAPLLLHSRAQDRETYLQRPDYGRLLDEPSAQKLDDHNAINATGYDLAIAVVGGLSSLAIKQNTIPFLTALFEHLPLSTISDKHTKLEQKKDSWTLAPICLVEHGRVAIGDDICQRLNAKCILVLIGERPGLSSPDSLGLYLTWGAKVGYTDAYRNCVSNIRPAGLNYQEAANKTQYLLSEARTLQRSGVALKDRSNDDITLKSEQDSVSFLTSQ